MTMGGTTHIIVKLYREGIIKRILTAQAFDTTAIKSMKEDKNHLEVSIGHYADCYNRGNIVDNLDFAVLGGT